MPPSPTLARWRYSGKEEQQALSPALFLLDYGARMYDPTLARWLSPDPLAEKYMQWSPYGYCIGNPIINVDPLGLWITIYDGDGSYQFRNGKLYQYQVEGENAGEYIECSDCNQSYFISAVFDALSQLLSGAGGQTGIELVSFFENENNNAYIKPHSENDNQISTSGSNTIFLSRYGSGKGIPVEGGILEIAPFWIYVGHELAHRQDFLLRGDEAGKIWFTHSGNTDVLETEKYATHIENLLRSSTMDLPLRTHYANQNSTGYEPSKIIRRNGKSIYYPDVYYVPLKKRSRK